jgi:hypothetical protein
MVVLETNDNRPHIPQRTMSRVVETDGEPDDMLYLALTKTDGIDINVGVGDTHAKSHRVLACEPKAWVFKYPASDHHFIESDLFCDIPPLPSAKIRPEYRTFVVLKPPHELMAYENTELFEKSTLYIYGSYNFRCLMKDWSKSAIAKFLGMFKQTFIYESHFATPDGNAISDKIGGVDLIDAIRALPGMADLMTAWDHNILEDCIATCEKLVIGMEMGPLPVDSPLTFRQTAKYNRNRKAWQYTDAHKGRQLVCGDFCIALLDDSDYEPVNITFDESSGYTHCEPSPGSSIHMVKKIGLPEIIRRLRVALDIPPAVVTL